MYFVTNSINANNIHINNEINKLMFSRDFNNIILPFLDDLIVDVNYHSLKSDIENLLGTPKKKGQRWIKYEIEDKYLHFEFGLNDKLSLITIGSLKL